MYARVTTFPGLAPERIKATLEEFKQTHLPQLEQQPGYRGVWAGVDYTGGRAIAITYWDSLDSLHASDAIAAEMRAAAVARTAGSIATARRSLTAMRSCCRRSRSAPDCAQRAPRPVKRCS